MEPVLDVAHLNTIFAMKKDEQRAYLDAVAAELRANPIRHLDTEWGCLPRYDVSDETALDAAAAELLGRMSLTQKIHQMSADIPPKFYKVLFPRYNCKPYYAGEDTALNIPAVRFTDGPTGIVSGYHSTAFPVPMARAASFDPELEERIGGAIGREGRAVGANFFGGVCINLLRHPAWGRSQETYGEDPCLLGRMGAALTRGVQRHMMACVKHFAANSMENARFKVNVTLSERVLREVYLPHFKACIDAGAAAVMSAYNRVNGQWCGHNAHLLRDILRGEWGFRGPVMSDFIWGVRDTVEAVQGGLDIEMPVTQYYGSLLEKAVADGRVDASLIDEAVLRILRMKLRFSHVGEKSYPASLLACPEHCALAREAAEKSAVLLKNDGVLPLGPDVKKITVVGRLARQPNTGDMKGSSAVFPPYVVTPWEGLTERLPEAQFLYADGEIPDEVTEKCRGADAVLIFVGLTCRDEGEYIVKEGAVGGDRASLALSEYDLDMIRAAARANARCVVVVQGGGAVLTHPWEDTVSGVLLLWYPGLEGGRALSALLTGDVCPGGKLPFTIPRTPQQLPYFDREATEITYDMYHGYFLADRDGARVSHPFGYGLSYASIELRNIRAERADGGVAFLADVVNRSHFPASEVVQLYLGCEGSAVERHRKDLRDFRRVYLRAEETKTVRLFVRPEDAAYYEENNGRWVCEDIGFIGYVGTSSAWEDLTAVPFRF